MPIENDRGMAADFFLTRAIEPKAVTGAAPSAAATVAKARADADAVIPLVLKVWTDYKRSDGDAVYGGDVVGRKEANLAEPTIAAQTDPLVGALATQQAFDAKQAEELGAFNKVATYVFGPTASYFQKIEKWSKDLVGADPRWSDENVARARAELKALALEGWPTIPFADSAGARSLNPYQLAESAHGVREQYKALPKEYQQAIKAIWVMFLAMGEDPDVAFIARFSIYAFVAQNTFRTAESEAPLVAWDDAMSCPPGGCWNPDGTFVGYDKATATHIPALPIAFATIAAKAYGAPLETVRRDTVAYFLYSIAPSQPTIGMGVTSLGGGYSKIGAAAVAMKAIEIASSLAHPTIAAGGTFDAEGHLTRLPPGTPASLALRMRVVLEQQEKRRRA